MGDVGTAYAGCRARINELVGDLDAHQATAGVPTCPRWSVHDVVAHLTGVVSDALDGRLDGVATDRWTAAQVDARRARTMAELLAEWNSRAPTFEDLLDAIGEPGRQAVGDAVTHEHDIRAALGASGARASDAVQIGFDFVARMFVAAATGRGFSLSVTTIDGLEFGDPGAGVVLTGDAFELLRAMTGRRSVEQLLLMDWKGDPEAVIPAFTVGPFRPSPRPIDE